MHYIMLHLILMYIRITLCQHINFVHMLIMIYFGFCFLRLLNDLSDLLFDCE